MGEFAAARDSARELRARGVTGGRIGSAAHASARVRASREGSQRPAEREGARGGGREQAQPDRWDVA